MVGGLQRGVPEGVLVASRVSEEHVVAVVDQGVHEGVFEDGEGVRGGAEPVLDVDGQFLFVLGTRNEAFVVDSE